MKNKYDNSERLEGVSDKQWRSIVCYNEETKKRAIFLATQANENALYYQHAIIGCNYHMSNICAGIGRGQMTVLEDHIKHHQHVHELYSSLMNNPSVSRVSINPNPDFNSNFWLTTALFNDGVDIETLCKKLDAAGIEARPLWKPMHLQLVYQNSPSFTNGFSEYLFKHGICLPSGPWVTDDDVKYIVEIIKKAIETLA